MNAKEISNKYADQIAAIAAAIAGKTEASATAKGQSDTLAASLRAYATATAGEDVTEARRALQVNLTFAEVPAGSVKASGNHFAGFHAMIAKGIDIETGKDGKPFTTADAQSFIASDSVKRLKALRDAVGAIVKGAAGKRDADSADDNPETRLKALAELIGADLKKYNAMLDSIGQEKSRAQAA